MKKYIGILAIFCLVGSLNSFACSVKKEETKIRTATTAISVGFADHQIFFDDAISFLPTIEGGNLVHIAATEKLSEGVWPEVEQRGNSPS